MGTFTEAQNGIYLDETRSEAQMVIQELRTALFSPHAAELLFLCAFLLFPRGI